MEYDTLPNWPWQNEYILTLESLEKVAHGVLNSVFDAKSDYQPEKTDKCRFSKFICQVDYDTLPNWASKGGKLSILEFMYQVEHDTLANWPWTNEYVLTLETLENVALGVSNSVFDTKSDYQHLQAEKCGFSKFSNRICLWKSEFFDFFVKVNAVGKESWMINFSSLNDRWNLPLSSD